MNRILKIIGVIAAVSVLLFALVSHRREASAHMLKIGVIAPITGLSGANASIGENYVSAIQLAADDYKKTHPDANIKLIIEDDGYDSKKGISAYKKLTSIDGVDAILNLSSVTVDAVASDVHVWNKPFIQLGEESKPADDNIIGLIPGQQAAIRAVGEQAKKDGYTKVSLVTQQISAYQRFIDGFKDGFGGEVNITRINPAEKDTKAYALNVLAEKAQAVVIFMDPSTAANFVKRLHEQSVTAVPPLYFGIELQFGLDDFRKALGGLSLLEGSTGVYLISETRDDFKVAYKAKYGRDSGLLSDYGYDSFAFLMNSYTPDSDKWISNLKTSSIEGVSGKIELDKLGSRLPKYKIVKLLGGELK